MEEEKAKKKPGRKKKTTHSSGMYRKRITLGHDAETGEPIVKAVYGKTKDELENKIAQLRIDRGMGVAVTDDKSTWEYWAKTWEKLELASIGVSYRQNCKTALKHLSSLNGRKISKLTSLDLSEIVTKLAVDNGLSKRTLKFIVSIARRVCHLARKNHAVAIDITEDVKIPQCAAVKPREAISPQLQSLLWDVVPVVRNNGRDKSRAVTLPLIKLLALLILYCGLRREEAVALRWENVDLKAHTLTVMEAYDYKGKRLKEPKSKSGYRTIPIPNKIIPLLQEWKAVNRSTFLGAKYVFPGNKGIMTEDEFKSRWNILMDAVNGISISDKIAAKKTKHGVAPNVNVRYHFTSHQLRHTYATNCVAKGIDIRTVQYLMGHAKADVTLGYTHFSQAAFEEAKKVLDGEDGKSKSKAND